MIFLHVLDKASLPKVEGKNIVFNCHRVFINQQLDSLESRLWILKTLL